MYLQNKTFRSWWRAFLNQLRMESHWFTATLSPKPTILAVWTLETRILVWRKQNRRSESGFLQYDFVVSAFFWSCFICWNTQRSTEGRAGRAQLQNRAGGEILNCVGRWQRWSVCRRIGFRTTVVRHCTENNNRQTVSTVNLIITGTKSSIVSILLHCIYKQTHATTCSSHTMVDMTFSS